MRTPRTVIAVAALAALVAGLLAGGPVSPAAAASPAPGGPGALAYFDLARKDCLGTARNDTSKVWYTVADGVLSDVYSPTIDNTNVKSLQFVVTDGSTFTDLQTRDTTYSVRSLDRSGMVCEVTSTDPEGAYDLTTTFVTDPQRDSVVLQVRLRDKRTGEGRKPPLALYAHLDPTMNGNGGGGAGNGGADNAAVVATSDGPVPVAYDLTTQTSAANRDYGVPLYAALRANRAFLAASVGYVGSASDGLATLDTARSLSPTYDTASSGNVVTTAQIDVRGSAPTTLALGFGTSQAAAIATAEASAERSFGATHNAYADGWSRYDASLQRPPTSYAGLTTGEAHEIRDTYYLSANVLKASEDKTFTGASVASLASPWGQAVSAGDPNNTYFGSYREVFARDLYETFTGLQAVGDFETAEQAVRFLFERQQLPNGSMPRNSLINGKVAPDSFGVQLDETAYPILMALQAGITEAAFYKENIVPAADFLVSRGPAFGVERWEEQDGFSPSTIASQIAGLVAAAVIAAQNGDQQHARLYAATADAFQRQVKGWTVTKTGLLSDQPYFIRLSKTGDPDAAISYNLGNGGPTLDQRAVVDAGFLELTRLGVLSPDDADILRSLAVVDANIKRTTANGVGWFRYNGDGYGDRLSDGRPWAPTGQGNGHLWPALAGERGEHALQVSDPATAASLLKAMNNFGSGVGLIPEQNWEGLDLLASPFGTDPMQASIGFRNGGPAGSAAPLTWCAAQFVRLVAGIDAGSPVETPPEVVNRYVTGSPQATTVAITSPPNLTAVTPPVTVSGTSEPGNTVDLLVVNSDSGTAQPPVTTTVATDGTWTAGVTVTSGTNIIVATATSPSGATGRDVVTVVDDTIEGTLLLDVSDPDGDDNGPGNYAYPTSSNFKPGGFDLQRFQVIDAGADVVFRVQTRDLTPTFGSPLGAQLVDIYVRNPAASSFSTSASFPQRNYQLASSGAWSQLVEAQGFGQRYLDASGTTLGTLLINGNAVSRFITIRVPKATLGTPTSGWTFAVVLTGQDGFSPDQARGFAPTPQDFSFGVCAATSTDPLCTLDPGTVPKAMDVLTPDGVAQTEELNYVLNNPVVIAPIAIP
ncbi:MAG: glucodextranase DOMON-like domain-containing protein [Candidatus Nanopelagicales bacterium]